MTGRCYEVKTRVDSGVVIVEQLSFDLQFLLQSQQSKFHTVATPE